MSVLIADVTLYLTVQQNLRDLQEIPSISNNEDLAYYTKETQQSHYDNVIAGDIYRVQSATTISDSKYSCCDTGEDTMGFSSSQPRSDMSSSTKKRGRMLLGMEESASTRSQPFAKKQKSDRNVEANPARAAFSELQQNSILTIRYDFAMDRA